MVFPRSREVAASILFWHERARLAVYLQLKMIKLRVLSHPHEPDKTRTALGINLTLLAHNARVRTVISFFGVCLGVMGR